MTQLGNKLSAAGGCDSGPGRSGMSIVWSSSVPCHACYYRSGLQAPVPARHDVPGRWPRSHPAGLAV
jgi:hypothetical protein